MRIPRIAARAALLTTGAVAALVLAGCNGQGQATGGASLTPSGAASGAGGATFVPVTSTTVAEPPSSTAAATTSPAAAGGGGGEPGAGHTGECKPANLKLSLSESDGAAGHFFQALRFTNVSKSNCVIVGFPGVSYVTGDKGTQVGAPAVRDGAKGAQITLHPGQVASAVISETDIDVFDAATCKPTATRGFRVYPPDSTASMFIAQTGRGCAGNPPSPQLRVQTIKPGAGNA
ncbi:MAG TPA: DUF4232 domain-containing protein [Pseudonocardiaceae bacterium]|nr:DUF4232 domain-containing protein [Pseudonocardiaceae bacterium]